MLRFVNFTQSDITAEVEHSCGVGGRGQTFVTYVHQKCDCTLTNHICLQCVSISFPSACGPAQMKWIRKSKQGYLRVSISTVVVP